MTPNEFVSLLNVQDLSISEEQLDIFKKYLDFLIAYNKKINLTSITDPGEIWTKHFYDSITPLIYLPIENEKFSMIDVGSGAGFPGIPMKIVNNGIKLTLLDATKKKVDFLNKLSFQLNFSSLNILHGRAEELGQQRKYRAKFDFAIARGVAQTNVLLELLLPFVKVGGKVVLMKSVYDEDEIYKAHRALSELGGRVSQSFSFELPNGDPRALIVVDKLKRTKLRYPRRPGVPKHSPLGGKNI